MPIYEFKCKDCSNVFEFLCLSSDGDGPIPCPSCGGKESEKLLSTFAYLSSGSTNSFTGCEASPSCPGSASGGPYPSCASSGGFS